MEMKLCKYRAFIIVLTGLCLLVLCVAGSVSAEKQKVADVNKSVGKKVPKISFNELHHDFGRVKQGSTVEHVFTFRNIGEGVLKIKKLKAG